MFEKLFILVEDRLDKILSFVSLCRQVTWLSFWKEEPGLSDKLGSFAQCATWCRDISTED